MKLIFLGSGSAFTVGDNNYQSNMLLETDNKRLLIDCGTDARLSLFELGYVYSQITDVYISHLHADHVGGLEWLAFSTYFDPKCPKPNLYLSESLIDDLWERVLINGLSSIEAKIVNLETFFNVHGIKKNGYFEWMNIKFQLVQTMHAMNGFSIVPSFGLMFTIQNKIIFITTDTQFCPQQIIKFYEQSDIIFQDCELTTIKSGVHANYEQLASLDAAIKNKMWLYHYDGVKLPNAKQDGFCGFIKKGQLFNFG